MKYLLITLFFLTTSTNVFSDVCSEIAKNPSLFIDKYSNKDGYTKFDIDNNGILNDISCEWHGTAQIGTCYYLSEDNQKINFGGDDDNGRIWGNIYFINFDNKSYILNSKNKREPLFLSLSNSQICSFNTKIIEQLIPNPDIEYSNEICSLVQENNLSKISYIEFSKNPSKDIQNLFDANREFPKKIAQFDYNNDGYNDNILEISYQSGAGRGCIYNYFEELDEYGKTKQNKTLSEVRDSMNCGGEYNKFFKYKNFVYFKYRQEQYALSKNEYKIYLFQTNKIQTVCDYKQELKIEVE